MIVQIRYYEIQIYPMKPSDVFRKRNLTKVNFEYEDLIGNAQFLLLLKNFILRIGKFLSSKKLEKL